MDGIHLPQMFLSAVKSLVEAKHVVIVTGFVIKVAKAGETDGPPGALALAQALEKMGKKVTLVTDSINEVLLLKGKDYWQLSAEVELISNDNIQLVSRKIIENSDTTHLIAIERPSRAMDKECYSMSGEVITDYVADTDYLFQQAKDKNIITIGIGDGGNEVGMGLIKDYIHKNVPMGEKICASTMVDYLLIGGVSNWVAYGLCGALSIESNKMLLHQNEHEEAILRILVASGAVDGIEKKRVMKVDGIDLQGNIDILNSIRNVVNDHLS